MTQEAYDVLYEDPFGKIATLKLPDEYREYLLKKADTDLSDNRMDWNSEILMAFEDQHPELVRQGGTPFIFHKYKDWAAGGSGCGLGSLTIAVGDNMLIFALVIRYGQLAPFDVYYNQGEQRWAYADKEELDEITRSDSVISGVSKDDAIWDEESRWQLLNRPNVESGRIITSSVEDIGKYADRECMAEILRYADDNTARLAHSSNVVVDTVSRFIEASETKQADWINFGGNPDESPAATVAKPSEETGSATPAEDSVHPQQPKAGLPEGSTPPQVPTTTPTPTQVMDKMAMSFFDLVHIQKTDINEYDVKLARRGFEGIVELKADAVKLAEIFEFDQKQALKLMDMVDKSEKESLTVDVTSDSEAQGIPTPQIYNNVNQIQAYGGYFVNLSDGRQELGVVIPIRDWNGDSANQFLFYGTDAWAVQGVIKGRRAPTTPILPRGKISYGRKGIFVLEGEGQAFCLPPIKISSVLTSSKGAAIRGHDMGDGRRVNLIIRSDVSAFIPFSRQIDPENFVMDSYNVYIPASMTFVPLPEKMVKVADRDAFIRKAELDSVMEAGGPPARIRKHADGSFSFVSPSHVWYNYPDDAIQEKLGMELVPVQPEYRFLSPSLATFYMKHACVNHPENIVEALSMIDGSAVISTTSLEKVAGVRTGVLKAMETKRDEAAEWQIDKLAETLRLNVEDVMNIVTVYPSLKKVAMDHVAEVLDSSCAEIGESKIAGYGDKQTLDELFDLSLLSKANINYFIQNKDRLDEMEDFLAKTLLTVRIAGLGIEESSVENALQGISDIKKSFRSLGFGILE